MMERGTNSPGGPVPEALLEKNVAPRVGRGRPCSLVTLYYLHLADPSDEQNSSVSSKQLQDKAFSKAFRVC